EHSYVLKTHGKSLIPHSKRIVVDLKEVGWMDSAGIGTLVGLYVTARKAGCEFLLVNYNKAVRDLLGISHLLSVFETCGRAGMRFPCEDHGRVFSRDCEKRISAGSEAHRQR